MRKPLAIAIMTLLGSTAFAAGEVYRWKDASGVWNYSDQFHEGAEIVSRRSAPATAATPAAPAAAAAPQSSASDMPPVSKDVAQQVRDDVAAAKAKKCEKAKTDYDDMVKALRIKRADAKGVVTFLTPEEMDAARLEARSVRDLACAP